MAWEVNGHSLWCNTADCYVGPECASEDEAYALGNATLEPYCDPRCCSNEILEIELRRLRGEEISGTFRLTFTPYSWTGAPPITSEPLPYEHLRSWSAHTLRLAKALRTPGNFALEDESRRLRSRIENDVEEGAFGG